MQRLRRSRRAEKGGGDKACLMAAERLPADRQGGAAASTPGRQLWMVCCLLYVQGCANVCPLPGLQARGSPSRTQMRVSGKNGGTW